MICFETIRNKNGSSVQSLPEHSFILVTALFVLIFLSLCAPVREIDFFWHLATGNWIINAGALPAVDPFSYTAPLPDNRDLLVLKGYWLSQVLYASFWRVFGAGGIVVLRAIIICGLFYSVYIALKRQGMSPWFAILAVSPIFIDMRLPLSIGMRPQLWSFLFASLFVLILDDFSEKDRLKKCIALSILIVLWNNLHPGVLVGYILVSIYLFCALLRNVAGKRDWSCLFLLPVLFLSIVNPIGLKMYSVMLEIFRPNRATKVYLAANLDGASLLELWRMGEFASWGFVFVLLLSLVTIAFKLKKIRIEHLVIIVSFLILTCAGSRYMIFFTILGVQICFFYWKESLKRLSQYVFVKKLLPIFVSLVVIICTFTMYRQQGSVLFGDNPLSEELYPKGAVNYLETARPPGNLFNVYEWGGYLMVFLPEYKVYIDGRGLGAAKGSMNEYLLIRSAFNPFWKTIFAQRGIGVVLTLKDDPNGFDKLNEALFRDPDWALAYQDDISLVFVRKKI